MRYGLAVVLVLLSACSWTHTKGSVLISDGCVIYLEAVTTAQAEAIVREWDIKEDCEVGFKTY